jgi:peptidyl-prolyl cis-trans isomerase B (cyclophilin B)
LNFNNIKKPVYVALILLLLLVSAKGYMTAADNDAASSSSAGTEAVANETKDTPDPSDQIVTQGAIHIQIDVKDYGIIKADLFPAVAPVTVANFVELIKEGFYDGLTFHRIIEGFMIQGGDPLGTGRGGSDQNIVGEFTNNDVENHLSHTRGVLSMARGGNDYNSASSQFFIVHQDSTFLDGDYAAFGMVTEGMEVVDDIVANTSVEDENGTVKAENQPIITAITIVE